MFFVCPHYTVARKNGNFCSSRRRPACDARVTFFQRDIIAERRLCVRRSSSIFHETEYERAEYFRRNEFSSRAVGPTGIEARDATGRRTRDVRAVILYIRITSARTVINSVLRATNLRGIRSCFA